VAGEVSIEAFLSRYPEFEQADEDRIRAALEDANLFVGDAWIAAHRTAAVLSLAAHYVFLGLQQTLSTSIASRASAAGSGTIGSGAAGPIVSKTVGPISVTYQDPLKAVATSSSAGETLRQMLSQSAYGQRFLELMARSFPAQVLVV
jgi:hypothetical protein